jgi:hypothetical protein
MEGLSLSMSNANSVTLNVKIIRKYETIVLLSQHPPCKQRAKTMAIQSTLASLFLASMFIVDTDGITSIYIHDDPIIYPQ